MLRMSADRTLHFRQNAIEAEGKSISARSDESKRAWLIVARDWNLMADREEAKLNAVGGGH
jgi:hypothetical protein